VKWLSPLVSCRRPERSRLYDRHQAEPEPTCFRPRVRRRSGYSGRGPTLVIADLHRPQASRPCSAVCRSSQRTDAFQYLRISYVKTCPSLRRAGTGRLLVQRTVGRIDSRRYILRVRSRLFSLNRCSPPVVAARRLPRVAGDLLDRFGMPRRSRRLPRCETRRRAADSTE